MGIAEELKKEAFTTAKRMRQKNIDIMPLNGKEFFVVTVRNTIPNSLLIDVFLYEGVKYRLFHVFNPVDSFYE